MPKELKNNPSLRGRGLVVDGDDANASMLYGLAVAEEFFGAFDHNTLLANAVQSRAADVWFASFPLEESFQESTTTGSEPSSNAITKPRDTATPDSAVEAPAAVQPISVVVAEGATVEIDGPGTQTVTFTGTTGTLTIDHALAFTGQISGLAGSDALDLADVSYGGATTATFLGDTTGGTLTITDGTHTADIALQGDYLSSTWTLSSDGNGGTTVIDPVSANNWQELKIGAGGWLTGIDIAPDDTMVVRTDTYGAYVWNGTQWQQLVTSTSMPAADVAH